MKLIKLLPLFFNVSMCSSHEQKPKISARVVGGYKTNIDEIGGFLVAMRDDGDFFCGGSLVTERIVVSAAHCISDRMNRLNAVTIEGGITMLNERTTRVRVNKAYIPKSYDDIANNMDVAVLRLEKPLRGNAIQTIKLCTQDYRAGDKVMVSGWGLGDFNEIEPRMQVQSVVFPMIAKNKCREIYTKITGLTNSMMCAGVPNRKDACQYDSGGPLVMNNELCGIVSFGVKCADDYPGVYTDVKYVTPWINKAIAKLMEKS